MRHEERRRADVELERLRLMIISSGNTAVNGTQPAMPTHPAQPLEPKLLSILEDVGFGDDGPSLAAALGKSPRSALSSLMIADESGSSVTL